MSSTPSRTPQSRYTAPGMSPSNSSAPTSNVPSRTSSPSKVLRIVSSKQQSTNRPKKGPGTLTSDLGKPKPKPHPANPVQTAASENRPLTELEEIDSALQTLTLPSTTKKRLACGCFGTKHPVFPLAPNCLNCGRIICVNEGIGPCFFCGQDLVSEDQKEEVIRELRHERGLAKTKAANEKVKKAKGGETRHRIWASKVGGQEWISENNSGESDVASGYVTPLQGQDQNYVDAERRRDELLEFEKTFAERTRIIDQQAEFTPQSMIHDAFSTPQERAAALRRMQQMEAEQAAAERARNRRVLDIDFKSGKGIVRAANAEDLLGPVQTQVEESEKVVPKGMSQRKLTL